MQPLSPWRIKHLYLFDIIEEQQESQRKLLNLLEHDRTIPWYIVLSSDAFMVSVLNNIEKLQMRISPIDSSTFSKGKKSMESCLVSPMLILTPNKKSEIEQGWHTW